MSQSAMKRIGRLLALLLLLGLAGCEKMGPSEHGVVFRNLPTWLGGGVGNRVLRPGELRMYYPWEKIYKFDTAVKSITWGTGSSDDPEKGVEDLIQTRTSDGNEVGLRVTIQYSVDPDKVAYIIQRVGTEPKHIRRLVTSVARSEVRQVMNRLSTQDFKKPALTNDQIEDTKKLLNGRLNPEGVQVSQVILEGYAFERRIDEDGEGPQPPEIDRSYQEQINRTEAVKQETEQELARVKSVVESKRRELNEAQARVNRVFEEAEGRKRQATLRGDGYFGAKTNEAEQVRTVGLAEVEGLKKQIGALSGPGGLALLRLAIAKELAASNPRFVLLNSAGEGRVNGIDVNRLDTNELIRQIGAASAAQESIAPSAPAAASASTLPLPGLAKPAPETAEKRAPAKQ